MTMQPLSHTHYPANIIDEPALLASASPPTTLGYCTSEIALSSVMSAWEFQSLCLRPSTVGYQSTVGDGTEASPATSLDVADGLLKLLAEEVVSSGVQTVADFYDQLSTKIQAVINEALSENTADGEPLRQLLTAGVGCMQTFLRHNATGPWHPTPPSPIELLAPNLAQAPATAQPTNSTTDEAASQLSNQSPQASTTLAGGDGAAAAEGSNSKFGHDSTHPHEQWAGVQLALDGEELYGGCTGMQYLLLAEIIFVQPLLGPVLEPESDTEQAASGDDTARHSTARRNPGWQPGVREKLLRAWPSWAWWAVRATLAHQQLLDGRAATLWSRTQMLTQHLLASWLIPAANMTTKDTQLATAAVLKKAASGNGSFTQCDKACIAGLAQETDMLATLLIELALGQYAYGYIELGQQLLNDAGTVLGLAVQVTGALGKRTVHQIDAKAQLVVTATHRRQQLIQNQQPDSSRPADLPVAALGLGLITGTASKPATDDPSKETAGLTLEEDVLLVPKLIDEEGKVLDNTYRGTEQALLLSWAQHIKNATAQDELQAWEMAPYVEAVLSQKHSQVMLQVHAHLLKIRHEKGRNRTRERALLHMEQLVEALTGATPTEHPGPGPAQRMAYSFATSCPLSARMRRELAEQYLSLGFVGAAVKLYESLEAWGPLVLCYRLLEKKALADTLIRARLQVTPNNASLWCSLGDLHTEDSYYETAWQRSGCRNARSKRSLGRSALRRKDWPAAVEHFEAALALNPLNPDAWFALGYAYLKMPGKQHQALKAFTRVTQQQPDHSEAWNNMAALWLDLKRYQEAFSALSQCVKHKRDSWQIWENYAAVAVKAGQPLAAAQGLAQVLQVSNGQRLPLDTLHETIATLDPANRRNENSDSNTATDSSVQTEGTEELGSWLLDLPGVSLQTMALSDTETAAQVDPSEDGNMSEASYASKYRQDIEEAEQRTKEQLKTVLGQLLKQAVNQPACKPGLWGCLGTYHMLTGYPESAKEAYLKQVRALSGTSFKSDSERFKEMAEASIALAKSYLQLYQSASKETAGNGHADVASQPHATNTPPASALRELAAARMHLRGILKQCEASFSEAPLYQGMEQLLQQVVALESAATASRN